MLVKFYKITTEGQLQMISKLLWCMFKIYVAVQNSGVLKQARQNKICSRVML